MGLAGWLEATCAIALLALTWSGAISAPTILAVLVVFGVARAFFSPAASSLVANLVPADDFANAIAWNSSAYQVATIAGPTAGGLLYGVSPTVAFATAAIMMTGGGLLAFTIPKPKQQGGVEKPSIEMLFAGFRYIKGEKIVLGAISLDLFAVLLGGAVALLPVYARDILDLGPWGLGLLRSAPGIGSLAVAVWLAGHPVRDNAGITMFICVGLFGVFTVLFGLSTITWLSIVALALTGAADMISVYVRETLIQLWTPDHLRGRVNAVNMVFIGASNEVGEFRAGTMAAVIGTVPAVMLGGIGAIAVAGLWAVLFPALRKVRHLDGAERA
jgi:MFS family permease